MARPRLWTCQRVAAGAKCGTRNPSRKRLCVGCGKPKPARREPAHMVALEQDYAAYVALNGGEHCAVCRRGPGSRRLDRDHCHASGKPRGLLCARCNRALPNWMTPDWLRMAATYLEERS